MNHIFSRSILLILMVGAASALAAQPVYLPVNAPFPQEVVMTTMKAHPELQKLGLHAIPPGFSDYAIIASSFPSKIGKESSDTDLVVVKSGKPTVKANEEGKFFDLCLPFDDAKGLRIGITVMEIPFAFAKSGEDALAKATAVRDEMQIGRAHV